MNAECNRIRIIRLYKMEEMIISRGGATVVELCNHFAVNKRTIHRDLALFEELGIPIYKDNGQFKILGTYKIPSYRPNIATGAQE